MQTTTFEKVLNLESTSKILPLNTVHECHLKIFRTKEDPCVNNFLSKSWSVVPKNPTQTHLIYFVCYFVQAWALVLDRLLENRTM